MSTLVTMETHLENGHVEARLRHQVNDRQRGEFKVGQRDFAARRFHGVECIDQRFVAGHVAIDARALVEVEEVRLDVQAHLVARTQQDRFQHGAGRALAIGARHHDDRAFERQLHALLHRAHAVQAHIDDGFGMARFQQRKPFGKGVRESGHRHRGTGRQRKQGGSMTRPARRRRADH
jgi:hypothetical protein